mgnify:CR=1 FL=1
MLLLLLFYGAKAAAGVIIITTKKGKQGKPVINVSANLAVNKKSAYRDYYSASGYLRYRQDWYKMVNTYGQGENGLYGYYNVMAKDGSGNMSAAYPQGYYDNPANMTAAEQDAWASAAGVSGFGPSDGESALSLFARRLTLDVSPLVFNNFLSGNTFDWYDATFRTGINQITTPVFQVLLIGLTIICLLVTWIMKVPYKVMNIMHSVRT